MLTKYGNRGKYFFTEPETGKTLFRDKMAERSIKRSYQFKRMQKRLTKKKPPPEKDDSFYTDIGLPPMPRMNSIAFDDSGREWKYTANGWEITEGAYDPIVQMKSKLEVVVAYRSKQSWFDLTNKSIFSNYKWNWFENRVSGSNVWGKMDGGDIDLGNPLGENSSIYGSMDSKGLGIGGGGGKLKAWADRLNRLPYFVKGFKTGTGSIKQGMKLYDHFSDDTTNGIDSLQQGNYNPNFPSISQSFIDSVSQANINRLPDTLSVRISRSGFKFGRPFPLSPYLNSKDSTNLINQKTYDSISGVFELYIINTLKK